MNGSTLKASEQGQAKIKQARERKRWMLRCEDTTPLKEASKFLIEQYGIENNWNANDPRWLRDWENLFRVERNQDSNAIKIKILQFKQSSILERIKQLIDEGELFAKDISYGSWSRFACFSKRQAIKARAFKAYCQILELDWQEIVESIENQETETIPLSPPNRDQDWADALDVPAFFGRDAELATLKQWILSDRCRLVAIIGMGGIGKTVVSIKLGKSGIGKTDLSRRNL